MAQYWTDFNQKNIGGSPAVVSTSITDWTKRWVTDGSATIESEVGATGGKILRLTHTTTARRLLSWNDIDGDSGRDLVEILARIRVSDAAGTNPGGVTARASGSAASETGYSLWFKGSAPQGVRKQKYSAGVSTTATSYDFTYSAGTWYWVRYRLDTNGNEYVRVWSGAYGDEPGTWAQSGDDLSGITAAGWVGVSANAPNNNLDFDWYSVGTAGDAAPGPSTHVAPALTTATATTGSPITAATIGCTTDSSTGTLYAVITTSATAPSAAQIKLGQDHTGSAAVWDNSDASLSVGANTFGVTGLTAGTQYYTYFVQNDGVADSNVLDGSFQTASAGGSAPVLSAPGASSIAGTSATVSVTTDKNTGTLYWFLSASATPPLAATLKSGAGSIQSGNTATPSLNVNSFVLSALSYSTTYYAHFIQNDADGDSNIVSTTGFTTEAEPVTPPAPDGDLAMPGTVTPSAMSQWMAEVTLRLNMIGLVPTGSSVVLATTDQTVADDNPTRTFIVVQ